MPRSPSFAIFRLIAGIAQLVERQLPKLDVAGSSPVARSNHFRYLRSPRPLSRFEEFEKESEITESNAEAISQTAASDTFG